MTRSLMLVKSLSIGTLMFLLIATTSSLAGEVTLKTIMPKRNPAASKVFVIGGIYAHLLVNDSETPNDRVFRECHSVPWVAPESGIVHITWYHPGLNITSAPPGTSGSILGFGLKLNGASGKFSVNLPIYNISRYSGGYVLYQPIVERFEGIQQGTAYDIQFVYQSVGFDDFSAELLDDNPLLIGGQSIIKIEYITEVQN